MIESYSQVKITYKFIITNPISKLKSETRQPTHIKKYYKKGE